MINFNVNPNRKSNCVKPRLTSYEEYKIGQRGRPYFFLIKETKKDDIKEDVLRSKDRDAIVVVYLAEKSIYRLSMCTRGSN